MNWEQTGDKISWEQLGASWAEISRNQVGDRLGTGWGQVRLVGTGREQVKFGESWGKVSWEQVGDKLSWEQLGTSWAKLSRNQVGDRLGTGWGQVRLVGDRSGTG